MKIFLIKSYKYKIIYKINNLNFILNMDLLCNSFKTLIMIYRRTHKINKIIQHKQNNQFNNKRKKNQFLMLKIIYNYLIKMMILMIIMYMKIKIYL